MVIQMTDAHQQALDELMLVFCTAIRYSFNRLLDDWKASELEKVVAKKYKLNIRQAKDAVESARQTIQSQHELVKTNFEEYSAKVKVIEKILSDKKKKLSVRKRKALTFKLEKRMRKMQYFEKFVTTHTIPPVIFGTKEMFLKRCKGLISSSDWKNCRNNRVYSRGDKTKSGNPNLRVIIKDGVSYLEVSTLEKTATNRAIKIQIPIYLPQKLSKKTGKVNGINYRQLFLDHLATGEAYQVEILRRDGKYYCHITFEVPEAEVVYTGHRRMIGIDTNPDGFGLTMVDNKGNYQWHRYLKQHELTYAKTNRRANLCGEIAKEVVLLAKKQECGIAIEDLKFKNDKDVTQKFARIKNQFVYAKLLTMLESACVREGIEVVKGKPQFTSKIGLYKYCHQYGMAVHNGAAMVIARRSYGFKESVPATLKEQVTTGKQQENFDLYGDWKKWSTVNKNLITLRKEVKNPDYWLAHRKELLGLALPF